MDKAEQGLMPDAHSSVLGRGQREKKVKQFYDADDDYADNEDMVGITVLYLRVALMHSESGVILTILACTPPWYCYIEV